MEIHAALRRSPEAFLADLGEDFILIGEDLAPADFIRERIDFLALDRGGAMTVIQFPPAEGRNQLQQALAFCSMVRQWDLRAILHEITLHSRSQPAAVERRIGEFLEVAPDRVNRTQRVILVADTFEYDVLITARWLHEAHGIDIRCFRAEIIDQRGERFVALDRIYPSDRPGADPAAAVDDPSGLAPRAPTTGRIPAPRRGDSPSSWSNWDAAMSRTKNRAAVEFFRREIMAGTECHIEYRGLVYRRDGHRAWSVKAGRQRCRVRQHGRFDGDLSFWRRALGDDIDLTVHSGGRSLRFYLTFDEQFDRFKSALLRDLADVRLESSRRSGHQDHDDSDDDLDDTD